MNHTFAKSIMISCAVAMGSLAHAAPAAADLSSYGKIMTEAKQQNMTPAAALQKLKDGNQRFLANKPIQRDYLRQAKLASYGQFPFAIVLNCMDSRSVPELFFDQGLADLFTIRVAGNILNDDIMGSMEYGTKVIGARLIVVLGHTSCGAVSGACAGVKLGHLTDVLDKIQPLVKPSMTMYGSDNCADPHLVDIIAEANAVHVAKQIQASSPIIKELVASGHVGIVAGVHDIKTGEVRFFNLE